MLEEHRVLMQESNRSAYLQQMYVYGLKKYVEESRAGRKPF